MSHRGLPAERDADGLRRRRLFSCALLLVLAGAQVVAQQPADAINTPEISFDGAPGAADCPFDPDAVASNPRPVFEHMQGGPAQAVSCAAFLDAHLPGWQDSPGAQSLVAPFVSHLLGDGTARGLQRHEVFIALLGDLERIEPGWRYSEALQPLLPGMILGSVVEDPFVANFWATTVQELDEHWRESETAKALAPTLYQLAAAEAREPPTTRNQRPGELLKRVSWPGYARLILATRVFDTWPKRISWTLLALVIVILAARRARRQEHA